MCLVCDGFFCVFVFKVETGIQSNFQPGMKLEVAKKNPDTYWVATVITTCGQLLLRYCGYGEDRADFWCDVVIADLHPVGVVPIATRPSCPGR